MDETELKNALFKSNFSNFKDLVAGRGVGNFSKSYELFKRITNVEKLFIKALANKKIAAVLDIGCGNGFHLCHLNTVIGGNKGIEFTGIEISDYNISIAARQAEFMSYTNIRFQAGSAEHLDFPDSSFDVVLCTDVIEHLPNPHLCLQESFRVLKPGGTMILTTPNDTSAVKTIGALIGGKKEKPVDTTEHISVAGYAQWKKAVKKAGFKIREIRRGALLYGGYRYNRHPVLFAFAILLDKLFDIFPGTINWCEAISFDLLKPDK